MAFPTTCDISALNAVPGSLNQMSDLETLALIVLFLYRRQNPSTVGQQVPANTLLASAKCLECGTSEGQLLALEAWIERQAAIDAGAALPAFSASAARSEIRCLTCLTTHQLRAIEMFLRCSLS